MPKFTSFLPIIVFIFASQFNVINAETSGYEIEFSDECNIGIKYFPIEYDLSIDTICIDNGITFNKILPTCNTTSFGIKEGYPSGPYDIIKVKVPFCSKNFSISCIGDNIIETHELNHNLAPVSTQSKNNSNVESEFYILDPSIYGSTDKCIHPYLHDEYIEDGINHFISIAVPLFGYNASNKTITKYKAYNIHINWELCNYEEMHSILLDMNHDESNFGILKSSNILDIPIPTKYYVIGSNQIEKKFERFILWKRERGYEITFKSIEDIYSETQLYDVTPKDKAEAVRMWLQKQYPSNGKFKVLFAGSNKYPVPVRKYTSLNDINSLDFSASDFVPSDVYYSDLTTKYSLTKRNDGNYTSAFGSIYSPLLSVGRLMFYNDSDIDNYTEKVIIYEGNPGLGDISYLNKLLVFKQSQQLTYKSLSNVLDDFESIILKDNKADSFENNRPVGETVIQNMSKCGLISLQGHGNPTTIGTSGINGKTDTWRYIQAINSYTPYYTDLGKYNKDVNNGIDLMSNINYPSVAYSISCTTMPFDHLKYTDTGMVFDMPYNIGSAYTSAGKFGGVAFIGNTRDGHHNNTEPMELSFASYCLENMPIGEAVNKSRHAAPSMLSRMMHNLLGDPEIKIWLGSPKTFSTSFSPLSNTILSQQSIQGTYIHFWDGVSKNGSVYISNNVNSISFSESQIANILGLSNNKLGDYLIQIRKDGYLPAFYLKTSTQPITNTKKNYILVDLKLTDNDHEHFDLSTNSVLNIECLGTFESDNGLTVGDRASVNITSKIKASLSNDTIHSGGNLTVTSPKIVLSSGFKIECGGRIKLSTE